MPTPASLFVYHLPHRQCRHFSFKTNIFAIYPSIDKAAFTSNKLIVITLQLS